MSGRTGRRKPPSRKWQEYRVGDFRLGRLKGEAVAIRYEGEKRHRYRLGVDTEPEGRNALNQFVKRYNLLISNESTSVAEIFKRYIQDRDDEGKQTAVMGYNWKALAPFFAERIATEITVEDCRTYARLRFEAGRAPSTVWTELGRLRTALQWGLRRGLISQVPYIWMPRKSPARDRVLTEAEFIRLLDGTASPHVRLFCILALTTGGRSSAILELTWDRVDFGKKEIDLNKPMVRDPMKKVTMKGRALVRMNSLASAALQEARFGAITDNVIEWNGKPVGSIKKAFRTACQRVGLEGVTPHTLRHTTASWQMDADVDMTQISRFLGHSTTQVTEGVYAKNTTDYLSDAAEAVDIKINKVR